VRNGRLAELRFGRGDINFRRIHVGDKLWKTSDPELDRALRQSYEGDAPRFQRPISMEVHGQADQPLTLIARDDLGHVVRLDSAMPLAQAESRPLTTDRLREQLGRLGGTPFKLGELKNALTGQVLLPVSELNRLRREAVRELEAQRTQPKRWTLECEVRNAECGMRNAECGVRSAECGMRSAECGVRSAEWLEQARRVRLRTPHSALRT
jgi:putative protease